MQIIIVFAAVWLILALIADKQYLDELMKKSPSSVFAEIGNSLYEPFDIEKECLKLQEEREKQDPYLITLWWGFDGLRLNADGSTEWISRRKPNASLQSIVNSIHESEMQAMQIKQLEEKLQELQGKHLVPVYTDFGCDIDDYPDDVCEVQHLDGYYIVDDTLDFDNAPQIVRTLRKAAW